MTPIQNRYDFVYLIEVTNGNPNGDPDAGNLPRSDPQTGRGLISDVSLKRKVRNFVSMTKPDDPGYEIYVAEKAVLNNQHARAWKEALPGEKRVAKRLPKDRAKAEALTAWMCENFFDVRTFGAVMTTEVNCGQVRGPVQFAFGQSVDPIVPLDVAVTRMAVTNEADADKERTMGRKHIVPYGLYRVHGFISARLAGSGGKGTGFSEEDLELFWSALEQMFDHDRSAARGEMAARRLVVFRHESDIGNAQSHNLLRRVEVARAVDGKSHPVGAPGLPPARSFEDYEVRVDREDLPFGVEILERF